MVRTFLWRLSAALATLLLLVVFAFLYLKAAPRGPYDPAPAVTAEVLPKITAGFDPAQPGYEQFGRYLGNALRLDFGPAFRYRDYNAAELLFRGAPVTLETVGLALLLAVALGLASGCAIRRPSHWARARFGGALSALAMIGLALPVFLIAVLFQLVFGIGLQWLPVAGWDGGWRPMLLPVLTLAVPLAVAIERLVRYSLSEVGSPDLGFWQRLGVGFDAVTARLGAFLTAAFALSAPIERAFSLPGTGRYLTEAGQIRDYPILAGAILFYGGIIVLASLAVDLVRFALRREERAAAVGTIRTWAALRRDPIILVGTGLFLAAGAACFVLPVLLPDSLREQDYSAIMTEPSLSSVNLLGTDELGRDLLVQLLQCGGGSIRLALLVAGLAGAILAAWRFAEAEGGILVRRWGGLLGCLLDAVPFLVLAIVLGAWWPARVGATTATTVSLVWLLLWLALRCRWSVPLAVCAAIPTSLVGDAYLAYHGVDAQEPPLTLGSLLDAGSASVDTAPWLVLVPLTGMLS